MVSTAKLRHLRGSAQKVRLVVDQIRGKNAAEAISILHYSPRRCGKDLEKLLKSAVANAQDKDPQLDVDELVVAKVTVDGGPTMKRIQHRAMGRVFQILKRTCHVTIGLDLPARSGRS